MNLTFPVARCWSDFSFREVFGIEFRDTHSLLRGPFINALRRDASEVCMKSNNLVSFGPFSAKRLSLPQDSAIKRYAACFGISIMHIGESKVLAQKNPR
jgi:hypothetical protein